MKSNIYSKCSTFILIFLISSCGCHFPITSRSNGDDVPTIAVDVVFQEKGIYQWPIWNIQIDNTNAFFLSNKLQKYDLSQKQLQWEVTENSLFQNENKTAFSWGNLILDENDVYLGVRSYDDTEQFKQPYIVVIDKQSGNINKRVRLISQKYKSCYNWVKYKSKLFFGYLCQSDTERGGFGYIDLNELAEDTESTEANAYTAPVHTILEIPVYSSSLRGVSTFPGDQYGYVVWYEYEDKVAPGDETMPRHGIAAINLANAQIAWEDTSYKAGRPADIELITDKLIFAFEYDKTIGKRGAAVYEKETGKKIKNIWNVWSACKDYIWDESKQRIYLTTGTAIEEFPNVAAIYCLDAETGNIIWSRYRDQSEPQIGMQPQVRNGVLYVPTSRYLELYDANTGKPLGRDPRVRGDGENFGDSAVWNDIILFHDGANTLYGVKMNWKIVNGQLVKE